MISFQPTEDLQASAKITFENMRSYYEHYSVDWELPKILEQIESLENWDILSDGEIIGAVRLAYEGEGCYLRDLQVSKKFQGQGIGTAAITEAERLAKEDGAEYLKLRVFKISPAFYLYKRVGFSIDLEEERFYYMSRPIQQNHD